MVSVRVIRIRPIMKNGTKNRNKMALAFGPKSR
jgi:hypothetical protein